MSHNDKIKDMDAFFEVNPITRQIVNKTPAKIVLMQGDHNSERFTFSLPRYIEGHDMAESAKANLHYINASKNVKGMYEMKDLKVDPDNPDNVICSWLISGNATKEAGKLAFLIEFECYEGDVLVYSWHTLPHEGISVGETFDNAEEIAEMYADVLKQWHDELFSVKTGKKTKAGGEIFNDYINNTASTYSHAEGNCTKAEGDYSHAEGYTTIASALASHAEGYRTKAEGDYSHAEGVGSIAAAFYSHAEGANSEVNGEAAHAEGYGTKADGDYSHAEGYTSIASDVASHAEGSGKAFGKYSHAENGSTACGYGSHAEGDSTIAYGRYSHAEGHGTDARGEAQHVHGSYNKKDTEGKYVTIVGNGNSSRRSNAHTLDRDGNAWYAGEVECLAVVIKSPSGKKFRITVDDDGALKAESI